MKGNPVRKTILYGAAGAMLGAAGLLVFVLAAAQDRTAWPSDGSGTLLWAIEGTTGDGSAVGAMGILRLGPSGVAVVLVPEDVSVKGKAGRLIELGELSAAGDWNVCCDAAGVLLGIPVTGYVVFEAQDVEAFLNALGSIPIEIPDPVSHREAPGGGASTDIGYGERELSGAEILAYVQGASEAEATSARGTRAFCAVIAAAGVSAGNAGADEAARRLLGRARSDLGADELRSVWRDLLARCATIKVSEVPTSVMVCDGVGRRVAMVVETEKLVAAAVRARPLLTPEGISVAIFNGSGAHLAATRAAEYLSERKFRVTRVGNADVFTYTTSYVVRLTEEPKAWILRNTLPGAAKIVSPGDVAAHYEALRPMVPPGTDLVLVVGAGMEFRE